MFKTYCPDGHNKIILSAKDAFRQIKYNAISLGVKKKMFFLKKKKNSFFQM